MIMCVCEELDKPAILISAFDNVALRKPAFQSSISHGNMASQAVDGDHTKMTFLAFLYKIDIKGFQKIKLPPVGIKLTTPTIHGLPGGCLTHSANLSFIPSLRFPDT